MIDLTTTYLGLKLHTPLVPSASPLSQDLDDIRRLEDAGASAVVLYSLFEEQLRQEARNSTIIFPPGRRVSPSRLRTSPNRASSGWVRKVT